MGHRKTEKKMENYSPKWLKIYKLISSWQEGQMLGYVIAVSIIGGIISSAWNWYSYGMSNMGCYGNISLYNKWASLNSISQPFAADSSVVSETLCL